MKVPAGNWYFLRAAASLVRNHPDRSISALVVLRSSIHVVPGVATLAASSLITTELGPTAGVTLMSGSPPLSLLARHPNLLSKRLRACVGSSATSENPSPSVCGSHESLYVND